MIQTLIMAVSRDMVWFSFVVIYMTGAVRGSPNDKLACNAQVSANKFMVLNKCPPRQHCEDGPRLYKLDGLERNVTFCTEGETITSWAPWTTNPANSGQPTISATNPEARRPRPNRKSLCALKQQACLVKKDGDIIRRQRCPRHSWCSNVARELTVDDHTFQLYFCDGRYQHG